MPDWQGDFPRGRHCLGLEAELSMDLANGVREGAASLQAYGGWQALQMSNDRMTDDTTIIPFRKTCRITEPSTQGAGDRGG